MSRSSSVTGEAITQAKRNFQEGAMPEDAAMDAQSQKLDPGHMNEDLFDHEVQSENALSDSSGLKRRRVTRACDECRRKKIKCDGKQPCTHCTVYSYDCTYDQPSNRRRNPPPQYIEALEQRLARTQAVLHHFVPDLRLDDASLEAVLKGQSNDPDVARSMSKIKQGSQNLGKAASNDPDLESMVDATGGLELDHRGHWDYYGHSSNLFFLRRMRDHVGELAGPEQTHDDKFPHQQPSSRSEGPRIRDPGSPNELLGDSMQDPFDSVNIGTDELPKKRFALALCQAALDDACSVLSFVHHPTFYASLDRIYSISEEQFNNSDHQFLPLLYAVLALGCLFAKDEDCELEREGYRTATGSGYKYYFAARQLMDVTDCRDITSLQAIIFMIMFLQCSAKLATCYAFIGVALRSAMRMGLHRNFRNEFDPIESECRKRAFWTIRKMDIYVGAILGLPLTLNADEIDQDFPAETSDECIRKDGIHPMPAGELPAMAAANANFKLCDVITKIIRTIYPIKGFTSVDHNTPGHYSVSYAAIREIEGDLQQWMEGLPPELVPRDHPPSPGPDKLMRMQQLLRLGYAHAQLLLYRPFLHYVSHKHQMTSVNQRSYACAAACVNVSRNIIHITSEMRKQGLLQGSYWFSMYSTFFGILSLVFFALENPQSANQNEILLDANEGKETLSLLAKRSMAADRCTLTLDALFERLGPTLERRKLDMGDSGSHKRQASASEQDKAPPRAKTSHAAGAPTSIAGRRGKKGATAVKAGQTLRMPTRPESKPVRPSRSVDNLTHASAQRSPVTNTENSSSYSTPVNRQGAFSQQRNQTSNPNQPILPPFLPSQYQDVQHPSTLSDMAAVMFPSTNPFAYPKQPMNTLEQRYASHGVPNQGQYPPGTGPDMFLQASMQGTDRIPADDHINGQFFGPLPPYLQGQGMTQGTPAWPRNNMPNDQQYQDPTSAADMWNQQVRSHGLPGMNFEDLFSGEDWNEQN